MSLLLFARFAAVEEPRRHPHKILYPLRLLLLTLFGAALSDMPGWQGAEDFARLKQDWLRRLCPWDGEATPSADTFERVLGMLDAQLFAQCFAAWMQDVAHARGAAPGALQHVALDGKSVQGAREAGAPTVPMHLVHAFLVQERGLLVGLVPCAGAPGEAPAAAGLLQVLELSDTVVTGDANLLSCGVADTVIARGGHYVLALKGNRAQAHAQVAQLLCTADALLDERSAHRLSASHHDTGEEQGHGRSERRRAWAFDVRRFAALHAYLPHAASVLALQRTRSPHEGCTGAASCDVHFYVSSLPPDAERLSGLVRAHWSVENLLHRQLDVVLHEDEARVGKGPGAENLATARRVALAALRADASFRASMPRRVRQAAHDDAYRTHLLTQVIS